MQKSTAILGIIPGYSMLILAIGLMNHVLVLPPLLQVTERDAWVSVLLVLAPYMIWLTILFYIMKRIGQQPILAWLKQHYGSFVCTAFRGFFFVYLFVFGALTLKETIMWTHVSYLPRTPSTVLAISLVLLCGFAAWSGMRALAISSGALLPFVIIFGDFVMTANLPAKDYSMLLPVFEHGVGRVINGMVYIGGGVAEMLVILLFQHQFKKIRLWTLLLLGLFLLVLIFGPVTGAITEFGPYEAANIRYPAYEEWRLVRIGEYLQHLDFLSIYQWLTGSYARISLSLYLMLNLLFPEEKPLPRNLSLIGIGIVFIVLCSILPISDMQFLDFMRYIYLPGSLICSTAALLILFALVILGKRVKKVKSNETQKV